MSWIPVSVPPKLRLQDFGRLSSGDVLVFCAGGAKRVATLERYDDSPSSEATWYSACSERGDLSRQVLFWQPLPKDPAPPPSPRLKVLPLDTWMEHTWLLEDALESDRYVGTAPRYHRPGIYLLGDQCWFELADGRAFTYEAPMFRYTLSLLVAADLTEAQAAALGAMARAKLATKAQLAKLRAYQDAYSCRAVYRNSRKTAMRFSKQKDAA